MRSNLDESNKPTIVAIEKRINFLSKKVTNYRTKFEKASADKVEPIRRKLMEVRSEQSMLQMQLYFAQKGGLA